MFPDSSGLSDDSQSGASHLWPTMVPPRYSPPHSHPDEKPPPYSPWAGGRAGWQDVSAQGRLAVLHHIRCSTLKRTWQEGRGGGGVEKTRCFWVRFTPVSVWVSTHEVRPDPAHNQLTDSSAALMQPDWTPEPELFHPELIPLPAPDQSVRLKHSRPTPDCCCMWEGNTVTVGTVRVPAQLPQDFTCKRKLEAKLPCLTLMWNSY